MIMHVEVSSSARIHLGFYTISSGSIAYGSMGLAVNRPEVTLQISRAEELNVRNLTQITVKPDIEEVVEQLDLPGAEVTVLKAIPKHVGLGSTTQIRLCIAYGLSRVYGLRYNVRQLAFMLKRGWVSGVGIAAYRHGGFILDSGRVLTEEGIRDPQTPDELPVVMLRRPFPRSWYFVVAVPRGIQGLDERQEKPVLGAPETNLSLERALHEAVLLCMLPALARGDARSFGRALTGVQRLVGRYFSKYQGGEFCCWETEQLVEAMLDGGAYGAGQSSWGPTAYGLVEGSRRAKRLLDYVLRSADKIGVEAEVFIAQPRNRGFSFRLLETS
jgi:beta-ribofuranosylaminobenzene 5'-phosphate synthase